MTVSTTNNRIAYSGNGVTVAFSFPNKFLANADLVVVLVVDATDVETTQTITTHYTVTGAGDAAGGTVTMLTAPAAGETLVIYRDPVITQTVDLVDNDPLPVESGIETPLDKLTLICQRLKDLVSRSFHLSDGDTSGASVVVPTPVAGKFLAWNTAGTALINATTVTTSAVSTFVETLLDDLTDAAFRTTLGVPAGSGTSTGTNTGDETVTTIGSLINGATGKTTPVDADYVGLMDSAASNVLKKLSWANIKATLKTYFDTLYVAAGAGASVLTPAVEVRTASATITIPTGATKCKVTLVGPGGGGAGCPGNAAGGPGGAGGALVKYLSGLTPGNTLALTIGTGGAGGGSNAQGADGSADSTLASGTQSITTLTAAKGLKGTVPAASTAGLSGAGGAATNGDINIQGGEGLAYALGTATGFFSQGGHTGFGLGIGGCQQITGSGGADGVAGHGKGSGGSGGVNFAAASPAGGAGADGVAIFEWYS